MEWWRQQSLKAVLYSTSKTQSDRYTTLFPTQRQAAKLNRFASLHFVRQNRPAHLCDANRLLAFDRRSRTGGRAYNIGETAKCVVFIRPQIRHRCRDSLLAFHLKIQQAEK